MQSSRMPDHPPASPLHSNNIHRYRNVYLSSITYASCPLLRSRLTQSGRAILWQPSCLGGRDSHPSFATHTVILTSKRSPLPRAHASLHLELSPAINLH